MMEPNRVPRSHVGVKSAQLPNRRGVGSGAFARFYEREYDRSVRLAWLLTGSRAAAEDVVQDAMTGVYRAFDRVELPASYLRRAVINRAKSRHRDEQRRQQRLGLRERTNEAADIADAELLELVGQLPYRQ